ncbi:MAG: protein kinase, partial [Chlamydiia bacterium]|nr:protein kinase [Chlamydiia bacterium]
MEVLDGAQLGDYNLIKQIGQGSLGTVYLAEHRFIRQQRVVKILPEELCDDRAFIQRFEEEVGLLATLNHPHIVKVHDISYAEGKYFLVTDCIVDAMGETTNLAQYLQQQEAPLEEEALRSLLRPLAEALDYAHHEKGVVHRGLKLNNILVGQSEEGIGLFLSDYGLTRIIGQAAVLSRTYKAVAESVGINQLFAPSIGGSEKYVSGAIDGSQIALLHNSFLQNFAFLAPEQKEPDAAVDYKADIYAFGVLAYYLLTRQFPEGIFDIPKWERLIRGCLARNPEQRVERLAPLFNHSMKIPTPATHPQPIYHDPKIERPSLDFDPTTLLHVDNTVKTFCPEKKNVDDLKPMDTEMVIVPGGTYYRGSHEGNRDEMPRHLVHLRPFAIEVHPVTNEQFVRFLEVMGG